MDRTFSSALLVLSLCGSAALGCARKEAPPPALSQGHEAPGPSLPRAEPEVREVAVSPAVSPDAQGQGRLVVRVERAEGLGLSVINASEAPISLAPAVTLERKQDGVFKEVAGQTLTLRRDCASTGCVTLVEGAELLAPSSLGRSAGERCDELLRAPAPGSYRFVVRDCSGAVAVHARFDETSP